MGHQVVSCRVQPYCAHRKGPGHGLTQAFPGNWIEWGGWGRGHTKERKTKLRRVALAVDSVLALGAGGGAAGSAQSLGSQLSLTASEVSLERAVGLTMEGQEIKCLQGPLGLSQIPSLLQMLLDVQTGLSKAQPARLG